MRTVEELDADTPAKDVEYIATVLQEEGLRAANEALDSLLGDRPEYLAWTGQEG